MVHRVLFSTVRRKNVHFASEARLGGTFGALAATAALFCDSSVKVDGNTSRDKARPHMLPFRMPILAKS